MKCLIFIKNDMVPYHFPYQNKTLLKWGVLLVKYYLEFKLKVVMDYLNQEGGFLALSKRFGLSDTKPILTWINAYRTLGVDRLKRKWNNQNFAVNFKLDVLQYMQNTGESIQLTVNHFKRNNLSLIARWKLQFENSGIEGLSKRIGRPTMSRIKNRKKKAKEVTREHELEGKIKRLEIENSYLKELQSLKINIPVQLKKSNLESSIMYWQKRLNRKNSDKEIKKIIVDIFKENNESYGYRRINQELRNREIIVNHKKIQQIQIQCMKFTHKSRKYSMYSGTVRKIAKNRMQRRFRTSVVHQKLTTDTSKFKYYETDKTGKLIIKKDYLDVFLDMFNGEVISYCLFEKPNSEAIQQAQIEVIEKNSRFFTSEGYHSSF